MDEKEKFVQMFVSRNLARLNFRPRYKAESAADYSRARRLWAAGANRAALEGANIAWRKECAMRRPAAAKAAKGKPLAKRKP